MPKTKVFINDREASSKNSDEKSVAAFPDPCFSPPGPPAGPVVIPYPNTAFAKDLKNGTSTVFIKGKMVAQEDKSFYATSTGNEAATESFPKGVMSNKIKGKAYFKSWSMNVRFQGRGVPRHLDIMTHNHGSECGNTAACRNMGEAAKLEKEVIIIKVVKEKLCNKDGGEPIANAKIKIIIKDDVVEAKVDKNGFVKISNIDKNSYNATVSASGYITITNSVKTIPQNDKKTYYIIKMKEATEWSITMIPDIMRANGWNVGAKLMDYWFSRPSYTYPETTSAYLNHAFVPHNNKIVTLKWALQFDYIKNKFNEITKNNYYLNDVKVRNEVVKSIYDLGKFISKSSWFGDLSLPVPEINEQVYVKNIDIDISKFSKLDDSWAALANCSLRIAVQGYVTFLGKKEPKKERHYDLYHITITKVGVYLRDSYDFIGEQFGELGYWDPKTNEVGKIYGTHYVTNEMFRTWREKYGCGGDFLVFSDIEVVPKIVSWEYRHYVY